MSNNANEAIFELSSSTVLYIETFGCKRKEPIEKSFCIVSYLIKFLESFLKATYIQKYKTCRYTTQKKDSFFISHNELCL